MLSVLTISRSYPNRVMPILGLWVEGLVKHLRDQCEVRVIAPVPYCPPLPSFISYAQYRQIPARGRRSEIDIWRPRYLAGPGYSLHSYEASTVYWGIRRRVKQLQDQKPFDLIHAHFTYPEGAAAARLGREYKVPVIITEHAPWRPWMDQFPRVRKQAIRASKDSAFHVAVSHSVLGTIQHFTGSQGNLRVVPVGVDGRIFTTSRNGATPRPDSILYVGRIHSVKGIDVLLHSMRELVARRPGTKLKLVGGGFLFRGFRLEEERLRNLARELELDGHVRFVGPKSPAEVAALMRRSSVVVLPSRAESFGAAALEALACGVPVVATRSGGPEDIVTEEVGVLVPPEDASALADGLEKVLDSGDRYDAHKLRQYALRRFSWQNVAARMIELYRAALETA